MVSNEVQDTQNPQGDPTIGRLVHDASRDISTLIQKEIQLAKSELKVSVQAGGAGIGLFAGAAFIVVLAIIMLSVSIAYFIHWAGLGLQWAFLIVFVAYMGIAALLGYLGLRKIKKVRAPERAIEQGREIPKALKGQAS
ncbi:phage holin family protein [Nocardioides sp. MAH-18]|uniref:Phage holin family protein n=1 Tax=Nocardioides agri TaxID=2682843 RepID=A0A6L6XSB4_9ACTN|nr:MULTISPECIES: phage holin family protein [unclassified Nocardioides]MBA2955394.1 phage holin family protein [Nocardioides sp. CGMCC 1.13656]MVQ50244.1 phage holin family protein [Nocardioides sp. MAH-18]